MRVVAHRGDTEAGPDNSLKAIEAALQLGVAGVEFDIQFEADYPFVGHDPDHFGEHLSEVVELFLRYPGPTAFAEVKPEYMTEKGLETVLELLAPVKSRTVITCYQRDPLRTARAAGWRIGWVVYEIHQSTKAELRELRPEFGITDWQNLKDRLPTGICQWVVYDVRSIETARDMRSAGAKWIQSKKPRALM